jgi:hypothetical protein
MGGAILGLWNPFECDIPCIRGRFVMEPHAQGNPCDIVHADTVAGLVRILSARREEQAGGIARPEGQVETELVKATGLRGIEILNEHIEHLPLAVDLGLPYSALVELALY